MTCMATNKKTFDESSTVIDLVESDEELWGNISETDLKLCSKALDVTEIEDLLKPKRLKFGRKILTVTDLVKQSWCEQNLEYDITMPEGIEVIEPVQVTIGQSIHKARELEIQVAVPIKIETREDAFAVKIINLFNSIYSFLNAQVKICREVPIFGVPFGSNIYISGIIDELRFDPEMYTITLVELKTRMSPRKPSQSQIKGHKIQVMLYQLLFNSMIRNELHKSEIAFHLRLDLSQEFSQEVAEQARLLSDPFSACPTNLDQLLDKLFQAMQAVPLVGETLVEYRYQNDNSLIDFMEVKYDDKWLEKILIHQFKYWKSERETEGVEVEETWKCNFCTYLDICAWRTKKNEELLKRNVHPQPNP